MPGTSACMARLVSQQRPLTPKVKDIGHAQSVGQIRTNGKCTMDRETEITKQWWRLESSLLLYRTIKRVFWTQKYVDLRVWVG